MILELASGAYLLWDWYHRQGADEPEIKPEQRRFSIPRVDNGAPVSMIYGRTRVRAPVPAWFGPVVYGTRGSGLLDCYQIKVLFTLGIPFQNGTNVTHGMWSGDSRASWALNLMSQGTTQTGDGEYETPIVSGYSQGNSQITGGIIETLNGKATQVIIDDLGTSHTLLGDELLIQYPSDTWRTVSSYRGVMSAYLTRDANAVYGWAIGDDGSLPAYSFECSSYKAYSWLASSAHHKIDQDAQPMCVLYDLLTATLGKAAIPTTRIHEPSWRSCAQVLYAERHGYSNALSQTRPLAEHVMSILRQIDAVLYLDPSDRLIHARLIRGDYQRDALREINRRNCKAIVNFAIGGHRDLPSRVRVIFSDRDQHYDDRDAVASISHNTSAIETQLQYPGVTTRTLAYQIADRELSWRSQIGIKMRAIVDRSFYYTVPGDVVRVNWTSPDVANLVFRVARVDRGTLSDGQIGLDLILDNAYNPPRINLPSENPIPPRRDDPRR